MFGIVDWSDHAITAAIVGVLGVVAAFFTGLGASLNGYFNTKPRLQALEEQVQNLQKEHAELKNNHSECEKQRTELQRLLMEIIGDKLRPSSMPSMPHD